MRLSIGRVLIAGLALLAVASLAVAAVLGVRYQQGRDMEQARADSLEAARTYASQMFGYTPANIDEHIAASRAILHGPALDEYDTLVDDSDLAQGVKDQKIVSEVTIQDAGVVTSTADTATVLIFMNQSVTRGDQELVRIDPSRLTYAMTLIDGTWKVTGIDIITDDSFRSLIDGSAQPAPGGVTLTPTPEP